jgi:5-methylthioribose kinase
VALSEQTVRTFLAPLAEVSALLGGDATQWTVREVGDGNLNLVFIVKGPKGGIVVKQSLPYVRMVGESWPLPLDRIFFEYEALKIQSAAVPHLVPKLYHFDRGMAAIVMELLEPHLILRKGLIGRNAVCNIGSREPGRCEKRTAVAVLQQHNPVQNHRRPCLHRPLSNRADEPLDDAATG